MEKKNRVFFKQTIERLCYVDMPLFLEKGKTYEEVLAESALIIIEDRPLYLQKIKEEIIIEK